MKKRRVLSIGLTVAMTAANMVAVMPAQAEQTNGYADYVPGEKTANLIPDSTSQSGYLYFGARQSLMSYQADGKSTYGTSTEGVKSAFKYTYSAPGNSNMTNQPLSLTYTNSSGSTSYESWTGYAGFWLNQATGSGGNFGFKAEAGKTYVFSANVKSGSPEGVADPYFGTAMNNTYGPQTLVYANEYGKDGLLLTDEWTRYNVSMTLPENYLDESKHKNGDYADRVYVGLAAGAEFGAAFWMDASEKDSVYFAEEQVYDIKNKISSAAAKQGGEITAEAAVVNQVGTKGAIAQDIDWFITNEDRTEVITDGFTVTEDENEAKVTIKIADDTEIGNYVLIAHSEQNNGMYKGAEFEVTENKWPDFVSPEKNQNIIPNASAGGGYTYFSHRNATPVKTSNSSNPSPESGTVKIYTDGTVGESNDWRKFYGLELNSAQLGDNRYFAPEAGKNYVFKMSLKDVSESNVKAYFGATMNDTCDPSKIVYTKEYGADGLLIGKDWTDFKGTFALPSTYKPEQNYGKVISIGFKTGTESGAAILIDAREKDSAYLAEEQLYEFNVTVDKDLVYRGETMTASAELLNQIGSKGSFSQKVEWFVANENKTEKADGFIITSNENSVSVMPKYDVVPGRYALIAYSEENNAYKSYEFTVSEKGYYVDYTPAKMNENIIPNASAGGGYTYFSNRDNGAVSVSNDKNPSPESGTIKYYTNAEVSGVENWRIFGGFEINSSQLGDKKFFTPKAGTNYVLKMSLKDVSEEGVASYIGASMTYGYDPSKIVYAKEYGSDGLLVGSDWTDFKGTICLPANFDVARAPGDMISVGYKNGTAKGAAVLLDVSKKDSVYLAEEQAYKIEVEKSNEQAGSVDLTAQITNQLGVKGGLSQEFSWVAVKSDKKTIADEIKITQKDNSNSVTVSYGDVTESGDYIIAAISKDGGLVKTVTITAAASNAKTIYVSTAGDDSAAGTESSPLKTLAGARDKVRALKQSGYTGAVDVIFKGGKYYIESRVDFTSADAGADGAKITYKAAEGEEVIFTGAVELDIDKARKISDADILSRLKDEVKDKVVAIDLTEQGYASINDETITATFNSICNGCEYPGLYLNGNEQTLAQWPNGQNEYATWEYVSENTIKYTDEEPSAWGKAEGWWIGGYMDYDYSYSRMPAESIDTTNKQITLTTGNSTKVSNAKTDKTYRWKAFNLLEELDAPSEWYIDKENNILYYYPSEHDENSTLEISVLKSSMIRLTEADNVEFSGITFENTRAGAISAVDIEDLTVSGCTFKNVGTSAVYISGTKDAQTDSSYWQRQRIDSSYNVEISDSKFDNIGGYAIFMEGGNVDTLTPSNNVIKNNIIYKAAQKIKDYNSVELRGCGNKMIYNNISCTNDQAIRFYGNDHVISYNEIHDVVQDSDDAGAIYAGRNTIQRGTEISYNYIHDTLGTFTPAFGHKPAVYWDDYQTGMWAHHNIIKNAYQNVYTNGVDNNYSYNTSIDIKTKDIYYADGGAASNCGDDCIHEDCDKTKFHSLWIADNKDLYLEKYKNLATILNAASLKDRSLGGLNTILGNVTVGGTATNGIGNNTKYPNATYIVNIRIDGTPNANVEDPTTKTESDFVNASAQDYRIKGTDSLEKSVLNENFDIELIGVQSDNTIDKSKIEIAGPKNNEALNEDTVKFVWYNTFGATNYRIEVATDSAMSNIIKTENVNYNYAELELPKNGQEYYWRVTAYNTSREFAGSWTSDIHSFVNGEKITFEASLSDGKVSVTVKNNYDNSEINATVYVAEYGANGALLSVQSKKASEAKDFTLKESSAPSVRVYLWDSQNSPLKDAIIIK